MKRLLPLLLLLPALARAQSTTFKWEPVTPVTGTTVGYPTANVQRCGAFVEDTGITAATTFWWFLSAGGGGSTHCSVSIYNATGSALIATSHASSCIGSGVISSTVGAFSLVKGTKYLLCTCSDVTGGGTYLASDSVGNALTSIQNAVSPVGAFTTANPCVAGEPPATTGALSADTNMPITTLLTTATP